MGRYIVLDIVFYGRSLNYDEGIGNYQELKKITKWDGRQYTLVSRYALRYSILETAKRIVNWQIAGGEILTTETKKDQSKTDTETSSPDDTSTLEPIEEKDESKKTGKKDKGGAIQPSSETLLSGELLLYPEFDLFGYLVTSTTPQNFRAAPVKISHAVSITPFNYDALFNANIGLANRLRETYGELNPNPFTVEEHETYYLYSVVIDVDNIGKIDIYYNMSGESEEINENAKPSQKKRKKKKQKSEEIYEIYKKAKEKYDKSEKINKFIKREERDINEFLKHIIYALREENKEEYTVKGRVEGLIKTILNLKRSIKGREEDLSPKLLVIGIYDNLPYKTYKDKIVLADEFTEEDYCEIEEKNENGKKVVHRKYKTRKGSKPLFRIEDRKGLSLQKINEEEVINFVNALFDKGSNEQNKTRSEVKVFYDPTIEVRVT